MKSNVDDSALARVCEHLERRIEAALSDSLRKFGSACSQVAEETADLATAATCLGLAHGKRLRAQLFYWGWRAAGRPDCDDVVDTAVAIEVFHLFALVHDDLMDQSAVRRGVPTAHRQLASVHERRAWRGDSAHFGLSSALLLGDALLVWADMIIDSSPLLADRLLAFRRAYDDMRLEVMGGQYLDVIGECGPHTSMSDAMRVARLKSGNYTVSQPLRLGAVAGGAPRGVVTALQALGRPLGEAFQIHDDILGVFGRSDAIGKPVGDDIRFGKHTVLISAALERCNGADQARLKDLLGDADMSQDDVDEATELIRRSGALDVARAAVAHRLDEASRGLSELPVDASVKASVAMLFSRAVASPGDDADTTIAADANSV